MDGRDLLQHRDPAITLFGRKIPLPESQIPTKPIPLESHAKDSVGTNKSFDLPGKHQTPVEVNKENVYSKSNDDHTESDGTDQERVFKKPDKIVPCPRCSSLDTKFCYFNNYNVNQPRHFCKNCQRYWTAGGTMRNVPIGAGRRRNKQFASQYHQIMISPDGQPLTRTENPDHQVLDSGDSGTGFRSPVGNAMALKFGPEAPLPETMDTGLNLGDRGNNIETRNSVEPDQNLSSLGGRINDAPENVSQNELGRSMAPYQVPHWVFPRTVTSMASVQQSYTPENINTNSVQWCPTQMVAVPGFSGPKIALQFVPASYWGCVPFYAPGMRNTSYPPPNGGGSLTLGKHSRDPIVLEESQLENSSSHAKTLRIGNSDEVTKSPVWCTSDIMPTKKDYLPQGLIFKSLEPKSVGRDHGLGETQIMGANPAALSRSHMLQEST